MKNESVFVSFSTELTLLKSRKWSGLMVILMVFGITAGCNKSGADKPQTTDGFTFSGGVNQNDVKDIVQFYKEAQKLVSGSDTDKMLSYFSPDFRGQAGETSASLVGAMKKFYSSSAKVSYETSDVRIFGAGDGSFISKNRYKTSVTNKNGKKRTVSGTEKIVWTKTPGGNKIVYWETR